jgi:cysteinyl-tRNA synthetase
MEIKFYNTLTNKVEVFNPIKQGEVSMYVCGPTVYNEPHIGNMRPAVVFDTFVRFLKYVGNDVKFVSNYTDVDDKIINKAIDEKVSEMEIANRYIASYRGCLDALNCLKAYKNPRVTEYIPDIIKYIDNLVAVKAAYVVDGEVFFDVTSVPNYGCLSNIKLDELDAGNRVATNEKKHNPYDFLLWKKTEKGIKWPTKWCEGRPGWHTECCVMIDSIFGGHIDIHGGGHDLIFPHHENEIAQAEATHHNTIANYWIHTGMVNINNEKMSKSIGNVVLAKDSIKNYGADTTRLLLLNCQYRSVLNFSDDTINDTKATLEKLANIWKQLNLKIAQNNGALHGKSSLMDKFLGAFADDVNIPNAITELLEIIKMANLEIRKKDSDLKLLENYFYTLQDMVYILGLHNEVKEFAKEDMDLYNEYLDAKKNKDFAKSDALREELIKKGII